MQLITTIYTLQLLLAAHCIDVTLLLLDDFQDVFVFLQFPIERFDLLNVMMAVAMCPLFMSLVSMVTVREASTSHKVDGAVLTLLDSHRILRVRWRKPSHFIGVALLISLLSLFENYFIVD